MYNENNAAMIASLIDMLSWIQINASLAQTDPLYARSIMIILDNVEQCHPIGLA